MGPSFLFVSIARVDGRDTSCSRAADAAPSPPRPWRGGDREDAEPPLCRLAPAGSCRASLECAGAARRLAASKPLSSYGPLAALAGEAGQGGLGGPASPPRPPPVPFWSRGRGGVAGGPTLASLPPRAPPSHLLRAASSSAASVFSGLH